jgi:FkbM family methyltransferase
MKTFDAYKMHIRRLGKRWLKEKLIPINRKLDGFATLRYLGRQISYDPSTDIGGKLFSTGEFEKNEMELCKEYISENSIVLDIGANIGLHSIYFSSLAQHGCVLSFEPSLTTFSFLVGNVANISNIVPMNIAVSDEGKIADFFHASDNAYSSLMDTKRKEVVKVIKVPCMRVDDVVSGLQLKRVDFVKIDVEGLEYEVLKGMNEIISKYQPIIFCEIYKGKNSNQKPDETVQLLIDKGYRAFVMCKGQLVAYEKHNDSLYNYLFLPSVQ